MLTLKVIGFLFVAFMAVCWIRPSFRHLFHEIPPAVVRWAYSVLTIYGLLLGLKLIFLKELEGSVQQYLEEIFLPGISAGRTPLVLAAVFVSLFFVLANLTRSYYNLHRIEDDNEDSALRALIKTLSGPAKGIEVLLRLFMFAIIAYLTKTIASIDREIPNSGSLLSVEAFRAQFDTFWHFTRHYYVCLLLWDGIIWYAIRPLPAGTSKTTNSRLLWIQAVPVHSAGLVVSLMMCLPRHSKALSVYADLCSMVAFIAAVGGCVLLLISAILEAPTVFGSLRSPKSTPAPQIPAAASAESEA
ncbi:MAG: hypothetical protein ACM336_21165 [Acidobacteriota bacterium]